MLVEREGRCDEKAFHDNTTGAVSEAPAFVRELPEGLPSLLDIFECHPV
jgi:hypothetical protein